MRPAERGEADLVAVFVKSLWNSQFPHKSVNESLILGTIKVITNIKDKLTNLNHY